MMKIMWWWWRWCDDDEMMMWWRWWEWRRWWWRGWRWWWCSSSNRLLSSRSFSLLRCYESSRAASAERRAVIGWRGAACARTEPLVDRGRAAAGAWGAAGVVCSMSSCRRAWSICARTDSDSSARFTANIRSARASSSPQHRSHCWEDTDFICTPRHRESVRSAQQRWHTRTHTHTYGHTHTLIQKRRSHLHRCDTGARASLWFSSSLIIIIFTSSSVIDGFDPSLIDGLYFSTLKLDDVHVGWWWWWWWWSQRCSWSAGIQAAPWLFLPAEALLEGWLLILIIKQHLHQLHLSFSDNKRADVNLVMIR